MGYYLASEKGYVAELASINGYKEMKDQVKAKLRFGFLVDFLEEGETTEIPEVVSEINLILPKIENESVSSTLRELAMNLTKAKEIAIVAM